MFYRQVWCMQDGMQDRKPVLALILYGRLSASSFYPGCFPSDSFYPDFYSGFYPACRKGKREEIMRELDYGKMGMRIRQVRKAKGWSQSALAEKCGISMSFLGHIERGSRIMSMETFSNICLALDAGADELAPFIISATDFIILTYME